VAVREGIDAMQAQYVRAMGGVQRLCTVIAAACLIIITVIIPWGVFTRYVLNFGSSWPEPMAVLLMIWFSFLSAAICYRENLHIAVGVLPNALTGTPRIVLAWIIEICMIFISVFMLYYGTKLVHTTWFQSISDFPLVSTGMSYLPVPLGGAIVTCFAIERLWTGRFFEQPDDGSVAPISTE
jgi:TRAP-type C4-dicarboxylate transport system permease small subunit